MLTRTKAKPRASQWTSDEQQRVDAYRTACATLRDAICEHAGDFLTWRGRQIARCSNRGDLPPGAVAVLVAQGAALAVELGEALRRVDWLFHWRYFRSHNGNDVPRELRPLEGLVEAHLAPLRGLYGYVLHPSGDVGWGSIYHQPLAGECWPPTRRERVRRATAIAAYGLADRFPDAPTHEWVISDVQHPVQFAFREVAAAAARLDVIDLKGTS